MALIGYRTFDGIDDTLQVALGNLASTALTPSTWIFAGRFLTTASDGVIVSSPGFTAVDWFRSNNTGIRWFDGTSNSPDAQPNVPSTSVDCIVVFRMPTGSTVMRHSVATHNGTSWSSFTHADSTWDPAAPSLPGSGDLSIGGVTGAFLNARIAAMAVANTSLADADIDTLTTGLAAWLGLPTLVNLWQMDQTPVVDLKGTASQTTLVGTTVTANFPLEGPAVADSAMFHRRSPGRISPTGTRTAWFGAGEISTGTTGTAQVADLVLTAVPGTVTAGAATVTAQTATLTLTPIAGTVTGGAATVTVQTATLTLTAVPGVVGSGVTVQAQTATLALTPLAGTITAGATSKPAQVATLTLTPIAGTATSGAVTVTAQVATITLTPRAGTVTGSAVTKTAQIATLTLTAIPGTFGSGITVTAQTATITLTAVTGSVTGGTVIVAAQASTLTLTPVAGTVSGAATTILAQIAVLTLLAQAGVITTFLPGAPSVFRRWRIQADDRTLAPIHDRRITLTASDRRPAETSERLINTPADTRIIPGDIP